MALLVVNAYVLIQQQKASSGLTATRFLCDAFSNKYHTVHVFVRITALISIFLHSLITRCQSDIASSTKGIVA